MQPNSCRRSFVTICLGLLVALATVNVRAQTPGSWILQVGAPWQEKLSKPQYEIQFEYNVRVPMRDGVELAANIWRPKAEGKFPVIFIYTPYDNGAQFGVDHAKYFTPRGYVVAVIDVRGRYDSDGQSYFYWDQDWKNGKFDGLDVYDCQTWLGEQPWSSGKIGMTGGSYLGFVQWMGAPLANRYLTTIIPYVTPDDHYDNVYPSGAMQLSNSVALLANLGTRTRDTKIYLRQNFMDFDKLYRHLPLRTMDQAMYAHTDQVWQDFMDHPDHDEYWRFSVGERIGPAQAGPGQYAKVKVPSLNITGWYDQVSQATINNYLGMVNHGPSDLRSRHHLLVGPWRHETGPREIGDLDYGPTADTNFLPIELRWYDYWLKGIDNGIMEEPPVNIFVMGKNEWRTEKAWPLPRARDTKYFFHSGGRANSLFGDGKLSSEAPGKQRSDTFLYDPENPVPTYGGNVSMTPPTGGPRDQRAIQRRADVLVYTSAPATAPLEVTGRILAKVYAASTARDTDFTAKLVDVHPNGYAQLLTEGIIRGRYRKSFKQQELLTPGRVEEFTIDLWSISHVFLKDHRIQVEISSSNFPKYDRNPNTGNKFGEDAELKTATQTVHHDAKFPSHIVLPVVD